MELFAKGITWEQDNEEGFSFLSFELENGYFTLSRKKQKRTESNCAASCSFNTKHNYIFALIKALTKISQERKKTTYISIRRFYIFIYSLHTYPAYS